MLRVRNILFVGMLFVFGSLGAFAADIDSRFHIHVTPDEGAVVTVAEAMELALPTLWKRVVPIESLDKVSRLRGRTSLVLQFKAVKHGVDLVFNPVQVKAYLDGFGVQMILEEPHWKLDVAVVGFSEADGKTAMDLMNYSYSMTDEFGFKLSPRGRKLQLTFAPVVDVYGQSLLHVDVQGDFSSSLLDETSQPSEGYLSYQLQAWVSQILLKVRDAYSLGTLKFDDANSELLITVESDLTLASQISLEQALLNEPNVTKVVPVLLQKERRQYRIVLRNGDDHWLEGWFAAYGLTAVKQPEGSVSQWLVQ